MQQLVSLLIVLPPVNVQLLWQHESSGDVPSWFDLVDTPVTNNPQMPTRFHALCNLAPQVNVAITTPNNSPTTTSACTAHAHATAAAEVQAPAVACAEASGSGGNQQQQASKPAVVAARAVASGEELAVIPVALAYPVEGGSFSSIEVCWCAAQAKQGVFCLSVCLLLRLWQQPPLLLLVGYKGQLRQVCCCQKGVCSSNSHWSMACLLCTFIN
jgi:hypothetical protein